MLIAILVAIPAAAWLGHLLGWRSGRRAGMSEQIWEFNSCIQQLSSDCAKLRHQVMDLELELEENTTILPFTGRNGRA